MFTLKEFTITNSEKLRRIDPVILICALAMSGLSILTLIATSDAYGTYYYKMQIAAVAVGFTAMMIMTFIDYDALISRMKYIFFAVTVGLLILVGIFGTGSQGNNNWISFGSISFQPSELVKVTYIMVFALHLDKLKDRINHPFSVLQLGIHAGLIFGLVMLTGDLGTGLVYLVISAIMIFSAGLSLWYFAGMIAAVVAAAPALWPHLSERQQMRILVGFNPDLDPLDVGWHSIASRNCIISGGFRGAGFSGGSKYFSLNAGQSDFLFAAFAEKFGFMAAFLYIILITTMILRILWIARGTRKNYAMYICVGIAGMLLAQSAENIGMCLAMLPVVGITLPFFSYGVSSMVSMYLCIGVVQSICAHNKKYYFERENG
ncbi:MAG: FtsW/RodA/SpoVE family cell cycle protein [Clostridia bacterium]|nr:FtsW/RodA/SpoVE family cell cycle protein [Clostridia bacterium]